MKITDPELARFILEKPPEAGAGSHPDDQPEQEPLIAVIPGESPAERTLPKVDLSPTVNKAQKRHAAPI